MYIIDNYKSDILAGYKRIQAAENELQSKWREPLLSLYARQRDIYERDLNEHKEIRQEFNHRLRLGIWMSSGLLLLGLLVLPGLILINELGDFRGPLFCFSPLLILGGLTGWAIIVVLWIWQRDQKEPAPPKNPLKTNLFTPLLPVWKRELYGELPRKKPHPGATGEYHFITRLQSLEDDAKIIYRINLSPGEVVDVILVGSKGIWVFKVLYLKGLIRWRNGVWSQLQTPGRLARRSNSSVTQVAMPFDQQWQITADKISETLQLYAPGFSARSAEVTAIRGGLVFTHPKGRYDIPPGTPFNWGIVSFWLEKLRSVPEQASFYESESIEVINALLSKHQGTTNLQNTQSMLVFANSIVNKSDNRIRAWISENEKKWLDQWLPH